jgi:hypothetical protein
MLARNGRSTAPPPNVAARPAWFRLRHGKAAEIRMITTTTRTLSVDEPIPRIDSIRPT